MRGLLEFKDDNKIERGLLFNFLAFGIAEERLEIPLDEMIDRLSPNRGKPKVKLLVELVYSAAINYCDHKDTKPDFTIHDAAAWFPLIGLDKILKLLTESISTVTPKNSHPHPTEKVGT